MRSGYSGKPLFQKLGLKAKDNVYLINPPKDYFDLLEMKSSDLIIAKKLSKSCTFVHGFFENEKDFKAAFKTVAQNMSTDAMFWVSWKKGKVSDMTEGTVRNLALKGDLVDVKVCSVSEIWSGLKLVVRKEKR